LTGSLGTLLKHGKRLVAPDTTTPVSLGVLVLVQEVDFNSADQFGKFVLVFTSNLSESNDSGGLLVHNSAQSGLVLDDAVGHSHLAAQSGDEDDQLDGVHVISNDDQRSLLGFNQSNDMVKTILDVDGLLANGFTLLGITLGDGLGLGIKTSLLLLTRLGAVFVHQAEKLSGGIFVEVIAELGNRWGDLQTLIEDDLLALKTDIFWPFDKSGQVASRLNVLTNTEVLGTTFKEWVLGTLAVASGLGGLGASRGLLDNSLGRLWEQDGRSGRRMRDGVIERERRTGVSKSATINIALDQAV